MTPNEIRERLEREDYDFLRTTEGLGGNLILLTTGGSHAYGTNTPTSDLDIRGVTLNTRDEILTMQCREKPFENRATDTVVYTLQQVKSLLANANPNVLEMLGTREEHLFVLTKQGELLRNNADVFLSKKAVNSFGGYATAQLRRLQNSLARGDYPKAEKERHILGSLQNQMGTFASRFRELTGGGISLYIEESDKVDFDTEIFMDINLNRFPLRDFKGIYSELSNTVRDYDGLNHRNKKTSDTKQEKHAMHLVRLLTMGIEILEGKGIRTYREEDLPLLMGIRNGGSLLFQDGDINGPKTYGPLFAMVDDLEKRFKYAAENSALPETPDYKRINELVAAINWSVLQG